MRKKHLFISAAMSALIGVSSLISVFSSGVPVLAAGNTPVQGPKINAMKYLVMDEEANVPNVTFSYTISPGEAVAYNREKGLSAVMPGPGGASIGTAKFEAGQDTYGTAQNLPGKSGKDTVSLEKGKKYARSGIQIDLTHVTFTEPGVYRYKISEKNTSVQAISYDKAPDRYLDVYIHTDDNGKLSCAGSVLHKYASEVPANGANPPQKDNGFENIYTTHNLTVSKNVKGNQASHNRYFAFTVKIESTLAGTVYDVDLKNADANVKQDGKTSTNPSRLTAGQDGKVTAVFMLRHGQSVCIKGLSDTTKYTVSEDMQDYDASVKVNDGAASEKNTTGEQAIRTDSTAAFVNTREGIVPTGIAENSMVWIAILGAGVIGFAAALCRKKKN